MIHYDGVIYALQKSGGISVLFNEIMARMPKESYELSIPDLHYPWQRYLRAKVPNAQHEIFHSTYYRLPTGHGQKIVTTIHDFTYERFRSGPSLWVHAHQKKRAINASDAIICVSENTKNDLISIYGEGFESRIFVVYNGVSSDYFPIQQLQRSSTRVLFVGARAGYKNFLNSVEAISQLPTLSLLCVGGGEFTRAEIAFLEQRMPGRYRHAGYLSNEILNNAYNESLCLLYPSLYEGFGIPVLEAMRSGCPVIAVGQSSIPEVAGEAAILLDSGSVPEILQGLEKILVPDIWEEYRRRGLIQVNKFSWDQTYLNTVAVYESLLGRRLFES